MTDILMGEFQPLKPTAKGIYVASKCRHAQKWRDLRAIGWPIISSWLDESEPGQTNSFSDLWLRNVREASNARVLLFYHEPGETMKGALVELGAALAHGVICYGVGVRGDDDGLTFAQHPAFCAMDSLDAALKAMRWLYHPEEKP